MPLASNLSIAFVSSLLILGGSYVVGKKAESREIASEAAYPAVGKLVSVGTTQVHVLVTGQGPDLVLLHGASGNLRDYTFDLIDKLKSRYRVIAFDRPGLGWTDRPDGFSGPGNATGESPVEQAALLQKAADQIGVTAPIVVGHSFGGAVALAWGLNRPDQTAALVTLGAVSNPWPGELDRLYKINSTKLGGATVVPLLSAFAPESRVDSAVASIFEPQAAPHGYAKHVGAGLSLRRESLRANAQQVNQLRPHIVEMSQRYGETLKMPVEILHGTEDTIVPLAVHSEVLAQQLADATLTRMQGVGHMPHHADPDAVLQAIDRAAHRAGLH